MELNAHEDSGLRMAGDKVSLSLFFFSPPSVQALGGNGLLVTCMSVFLIKLPRTEVTASGALRARLDAEGSSQSRHRTQEDHRKLQLL